MGCPSQPFAAHETPFQQTETGPLRNTIGTSTAPSVISSSALAPDAATLTDAPDSTGSCVRPGQRALPSRVASGAGPIRPHHVGLWLKSPAGSGAVQVKYTSTYNIQGWGGGVVLCLLGFLQAAPGGRGEGGGGNPLQGWMRIPRPPLSAGWRPPGGAGSEGSRRGDWGGGAGV